jgi:hypothetical protein
MTRKLNESDRAAVDLLFDRINAAAVAHMNRGNPGESVYAAPGAVSEQRLAAVEKMLSLLDEMPAIEPPADLASRTIARVSRAAGSPIPSIAPVFGDPTQPLA